MQGQYRKEQTQIKEIKVKTAERGQMESVGDIVPQCRPI